MPGALIPVAEAVPLAVSPVGPDEFAGLMNAPGAFYENHPFAVAVSGGPDSMALAWCAWRRFTEKNCIAFIVDHGLRPESAAEAKETKKRVAALGMQSEILRWEHAPVVTRLHISARKARYRLLIDACRRHGLANLLLAHQREDQAETILMRFAKGSGVDGLAGMNASSTIDGVRLLRPFLNIPKERLIATCREAGLNFIEDASNRSDKFARGRLRKVMPLLAEEGLTIERLIDLGARAGEAKEALDHYTQSFMRSHMQQDDAGVIRIDLKQFCAVPRAIAGRALAVGLQSVHAEDYAPEHAPLMRLRDALCAAEEMTPRTLHGCLVSKSTNTVTLMREFAGITDALTIHPGESLIWDGRWKVTLEQWHSLPLVGRVREGGDVTGAAFDLETLHSVSPPLPQPLPRGEGGSIAPVAAGFSNAPSFAKAEMKQENFFTIRPLGLPPHETLDALAPGLRKEVPQGRARASLPALWQGEQLVLIPSLKDSGEARAQLVSAWLPL